MVQVLKALEAAQKEPKAPLSDMFTDGKTAAAEKPLLACSATSDQFAQFHSVVLQSNWLSGILNGDCLHQ